MNQSCIEKRHADTLPEFARGRRTVMPRVDIIETDEAFVLIADVPGVDKDGINVRLSGDDLTLEATPRMTELQGFHGSHSEYEAVNYRRAFRLSPDVGRDTIEAKVKNGVLRLTLPKAPASKPTHITIKTT